MLILLILRAHAPSSSPPSALAPIGSAALSMLLLLVAPAVRDALALLYCTPVVVSASDAAVLDGGPAAPPPGSPPALITLSVLANDPEYVCWAIGGSHLPAGAVAALTLFTAGAALPTALLAATVVLYESLARGAQGSPWVVATCAAWRRFCPRLGGGTLLTGRAPASGGVLDFAGATSADSLGCSSGLIATPAVGGKDRSSQPGRALPWLTWLADAYRPRLWPALFADIAVAVALAALAALVPRPTTALAIAGKAGGICVATLGLSTYLTASRPYAQSLEHAWKQPMRAAMLAVSAAAAIVVAWAAAIDARGTGPSDAEATGLAFLSYATCAGLGVAVTLAGWDAFSSLLLRTRRLRAASIMARAGAGPDEPPAAEWGVARELGRLAPRPLLAAAPSRGRLLELAPVVGAAVAAVGVSPLRRFADRVAAARAAPPATSEAVSASGASPSLTASQAPLEAPLAWAHIALDSARVHGASMGARVDVATVLRRPLSTRSPEVLLQQGQRIGGRRGHLVRSPASRRLDSQPLSRQPLPRGEPPGYKS